jgi:hypothetical protein
LAGEGSRATNPDTGLLSWDSGNNGALVHLAQLTPDQTRAFFINRGLPRAAVEEYAASCVFMVIVRNESAGSLAYHLGDWRARDPSGERGLLLKDHWLRSWERHEVTQAARIAFEWSQLPVEQGFERGDWNQGMISVPLPDGAAFDLVYRLGINGEKVEGAVKGVSCAADH